MTSRSPRYRIVVALLPPYELPDGCDEIAAAVAEAAGALSLDASEVEATRAARERRARRAGNRVMGWTEYAPTYRLTVEREAASAQDAAARIEAEVVAPEGWSVGSLTLVGRESPSP